MKVALVHDFLVEYGGGEKVLQAFHEMYPGAPVYTTVFDEALLKSWPELKDWDIRTPKITKIPVVKHFYKYFTFLYSMLVENFDLSGFDVILSSSTFMAKGVITGADQKHIAYIHTPARFLYNLPTETSDKRSKWYWRIVLDPLDSILRLWDFQAAKRPDVLVANSQTTAKRIEKFYRRNSKLVYPPVELGELEGTAIGFEQEPFKQGYFLSVSRLCAYKNVDLAIRVCNKLKLPLVVVGSGREESELKKIAGPTIRFEGFVKKDRLEKLYRGCRGLIFAVSNEDFGIVPVEAMSYGKPVVAFKSGGVTETVVEGETGLFFDKLTEESLAGALERFEETSFDPQVCRARAERFSKERFKEEINKLL